MTLHSFPWPPGRSLSGLPRVRSLSGGSLCLCAEGLGLGLSFVLRLPGGLVGGTVS